MKQNRFLYLVMAAMAVCLLASCSSDSELSSATDTAAEQVVRVTTNVDDVHSRAIYTTNNLDAFGMSIINPSNSKYTYNNVKWTKNGKAWSSPSTMFWQNATQPVTIVAYAPYNSSETLIHEQDAYSFSVSEDQTSYLDRSDFIVYKKTDFVPKDDLDENKSIMVGFSHLLSQLTVTIKFTGNEFVDDYIRKGQNPISSVKINGTKLAAKVNFTETPISVVADGSEGSVISTNLTGETLANAPEAVYSAILVPQNIAANTLMIDVTAGGKKYSWKSSSAISLESGKGYSLGLTIGKDKISASSITVSNWGAGGDLPGGDVERSEADLIKAKLAEYDFSGTADMDLELTLTKNAEAEVFQNIAEAIKSGNVAVNLTLNGVITVPGAALSDVQHLKSIHFPEVKILKDNAIVDCADLQTVILPEAGTIGKSVFSGCYKLSAMQLGNVLSVHNPFLGNLTDDQVGNMTLMLPTSQLVLDTDEDGYWTLTQQATKFQPTTMAKNNQFLDRIFDSITFYGDSGE